MTSVDDAPGTPARVTVRLARPEDVARLATLLAAGTLRAGEDPADLGPYQAALAEISATSAEGG